MPIPQVSPFWLVFLQLWIMPFKIELLNTGSGLLLLFKMNRAYKTAEFIDVVK